MDDEYRENRERVRARQKEEPLRRFVKASKAEYIQIPEPGRYRVECKPMGGEATMFVLVRCEKGKHKRSS